MSGIIALFDDIAAIAKLAAAQLDDIAAQAAKAGTKAAGVVIDDAAVTPKYVANLPASRELPIVWKIARASFFNKLVILTPAALLLDAFLPWVLTPLLMLGGCYLCFEGAEKVWHALQHKHDHSEAQDAETLDAAHLEERRVKGAIKTDFILSAEVMTISLSAIEVDTFWIQAAVLVLVAIGITAAVYGAVALLVKADDLGLKLSQSEGNAGVQALGRAIVANMPKVMTLIATIGTAAMLWVGGNIIVHGLHDLGWHFPYDTIKAAGKSVSTSLGFAKGFVNWFVIASFDGIIGILVGSALMPLVERVIAPFAKSLFPERDEAKPA